MGPLVLRQGSDVLSVEEDTPLVHGPDARDRVEHGGLARAVAADDSDKVAGLEVQAQTVEGLFLVNGTGVKSFGNVLQVQHRFRPPSS